MTLSVVIIDDEAALVRSLSFALKAEGYKALGAHDGGEGLALVARERPAVVLLDLHLPDMSGMEVLERLRHDFPDLPVVMISAHGDTRAAVRAVKLGAADYLTKPFELDDLFHVITQVQEREKMSSEIAFHRQGAVQAAGTLIGDSPVMRSLDDTIRLIAASNASRVLLLGESGTGKALVARAIHSRSSRANGPFIEINCASLPEQLIEAELFGSEKGAYTGAQHKRAGLVSLADGGTLFLDEVGELPLALQAKLLHFLENGDYRALGSGRTLKADVRVVTATNRDLQHEVHEGRFRPDLFYRLNVIHVRLPPLRDRGDDILALAETFAQRFACEENTPRIGFDADTRRLLRGYGWPGNVRELKNLIERLTILRAGRTIEVADLPVEICGQPAGSGAIGAVLADAERALVEDALRQACGQKGRAAEILGISRHALKRRLARLGLE